MSTTARDTRPRTDNRARGRDDRPARADARGGRRGRSEHASRDLSMGGMAVLDRTGEHPDERTDRGSDPRATAAWGAPTKAPQRHRSTRRAPENLHTTPVPSTGFQRKLGSKQVVSVRGRRVGATKRTSMLAKLSAVALGFLIGGVALAMFLSGVSTQQTFQLQQLVAQESQLDNQLESLNRDLENSRSSAEIARQAAEMGLVVPNQPGILAVAENGETAEQRPADLSTRPIIDMHGQPVPSNPASSNPADTEELSDNLEAIPEGESQLPADQPAPAPAPVPEIAPYAPNVAAAPNEDVAQDDQAGEDSQ